MDIICVEGYKAFRGVMKVTPGNPAYEPYLLSGDWLYKPDVDCWYSHGRSFPARTCSIVSTVKMEDLANGLSN